MTQQEYAEYLFEILGEEPCTPDDYHRWEDFFWGLFQSFMPNGEGVAAVFEPLERGQELLERILSVYQATAECSAEILDSGNTPAFFDRSAEGAKQVSINGQTLLFPPSAPEGEDARARQTDERLLEGLREFAIFYGDEELIETLTAVRRICFGLPKKDFNEADELFYEIFYQWRQDNIDPDSPNKCWLKHIIPYTKTNIWPPTCNTRCMTINPTATFCALISIYGSRATASP